MLSFKLAAVAPTLRDRCRWIVGAVVVAGLTACGGGGGGAEASAPAVAITAQPADQTVIEGQPARFAATATNASSYQWQENAGSGWNNLAGATQAAHVVSPTAMFLDGRQYRVVVSGGGTSILSSAATLRVSSAVIAPSISVSPADQAVVEGNDALFTVTASGTSLSYTWQVSVDSVAWIDLSSADGATLLIRPAGLTLNGNWYRAVIRNSAGSASSAAARLTVQPTPAQPSFTSQPVSVTVLAGQPAVFSAVAVGSPAPAIQWESSPDATSWSAIPAAQSSSYSTGPASVAQSGTWYRAVASNALGVATSGAAMLTVHPLPSLPSFTQQPQAVATAAGTSASFSASAIGTPSPVLQWQISTDGVAWANITGATAFSYSVQAVSAADNYRTYRLVASNTAGAVTSDAAALVVSAAAVGTGSLTLLAGQLGGHGSLDGTGSAARFSDASSLAIDSLGHVYVADGSESTVRRITPAGVVTTFAGAPGQSGNVEGTGVAARFSTPVGLAIDAADNLYVADLGNNAIRRITPGGRLSTLATVVSPLGVAVDAFGVVYVASSHCVIQKVMPDGTVTTLAGVAAACGHADGVGASARFNSPYGIAIDAGGTLYVADTFSHTIRKITPSGTVTTLAGMPNERGSADGVGHAARFDQPQQLVVDPAGHLYVADTENRTIRRVTAAGAVSTEAGVAGGGQPTDGAASLAHFVYPKGIARAPNGDLFVGDGRQVRKLSAGTVSTLAGRERSIAALDGPGVAAAFFGPTGLAVDATGHTYVADTGNKTIRKIAPDGTVRTLALTLPGGTSLEPGGVALNAAGTLFVADTFNHVVRMITPAGVVSTLAGQVGVQGAADGTGSSARFSYPRKLVADGAGNLYVTDWQNHTVRRIAPDGSVSTIAGLAGQAGAADGPGSAARFNAPVGIAVDGAGNILVADFGNHTVRRIDSNGAVTTLAGMAGLAGSADGEGSAARFRAPVGLAALQGAVYVTDAGNGMVRRISSAGMVTTVAGVAGQRGVRLGSDARLGEPHGLAVLDANRLVLSDENAVLVLTLP
jgi:sugar lactone lactonase YvrE